MQMAYWHNLDNRYTYYLFILSLQRTYPSCNSKILDRKFACNHQCQCHYLSLSWKIIQHFINNIVPYLHMKLQWDSNINLLYYYYYCCYCYYYVRRKMINSLVWNSTVKNLPDKVPYQFLDCHPLNMLFGYQIKQKIKNNCLCHFIFSCFSLSLSNVKGSQFALKKKLLCQCEYFSLYFTNNNL